MSYSDENQATQHSAVLAFCNKPKSYLFKIEPPPKKFKVEKHRHNQNPHLSSSYRWKLPWKVMVGGEHECNFTASMSSLFSGCVFVIIGLGNVLSPFGAKPLPYPMLTDGQIGILKPQMQ